MSRLARHSRTHSGTASLELVMVAPFLLALMMLVIAFGRFAQTENLIDQAARDAARAATAQNDKGKVASVVSAVVDEAMADAPDSCRRSARAQPPKMTASAYGVPDPDNPLAIESVSITVLCDLDLSDLAALPLQTVRIERTFTSPLDRYRGYQ